MQLKKKTKQRFSKSGLILLPSLPIFGASPDGLSDKFVLEIKCPLSEKSKLKYVTKNGKIGAKFEAQMQLQMHFSEKKNALFCVASPDFESNNKVDVIEVEYNKYFTEALILKAQNFWEKEIWPILMKL